MKSRLYVSDPGDLHSEQHVSENSAKAFMNREMPEQLLRLQEDHEHVLEECENLAEETRRISRRGTIDTLFAERAIPSIERLSIFMKAHHSKEEELLLPIIQEHLDSEVGRYLREEHGRISKELLKLLASATGLRTGSKTNSLETLATSIIEFNSQARVHFLREENVLYWYASLFLPRNGLNDMSNVNNRKTSL